MLICSAPLLCPTSRHGGTGECLDEVALDGAQLIGAAEVRLNGRHEPVEDLGRARPAVELVPGKQLRPARPMPAATRGFPGAFPGASRRQTGGIPVFFHGIFAISVVVAVFTAHR